ncbi:uncharacterized protein At4g02000-like [Primulina tabacum]|uniref:uncharacterized protein At4g02000-like n=1 Tax=Primulina tabacum TaxID=48773 RepID=UPI003F5A2631
MAGLSLIDDEDDEIAFDLNILQIADDANELCLVGIFLTERQINLNIMKQRLSSIWRPGKRVTIREIGFKRFIFQFYHSVDLQRILEGGPWTFDNNFLLLHHLKREEQPLQVPLRHLNFWIQIHDLPFGYMSEAVGRQLGSYMGNFLEYDSNNNKGSWRPYMRIRVAIDVQNPLKQCKKIGKSNGESFLRNSVTNSSI